MKSIPFFICATLAVFVSAAMGWMVRLSDGANGHTVRLHVNDGAQVDLPSDVQGDVAWVWSPVDADPLDGALYQNSSIVWPDGSSTARYSAIKPGNATLSAYKRCKPLKNDIMCTMVIYEWKVHVVVV
ncbi:hypothetical protein BC940DRAFT_306899 [Gongronella butleri]|nr:hypothetical protein BC940DRAFT_306899 [Gongronella butleri]